MRAIKYVLGIGALAALLAGCLPPKPAPPPPPPKFTLPAGLWRTAGTAPGATECHFTRIGATGNILADVVSDHGARYIQTAATDSEFRTSGCQTWTAYDGTEQPGGSVAIPDTSGPPPNCCQIFMPRRSFKDGDYIVGHENFGPPPEDVTGDVNAGTVTISEDQPACRWYKLSNWSGEAGAVLQQGFDKGDGATPLQPGSIHLVEGQGIRLVDCGGMFWWHTD